MQYLYIHLRSASRTPLAKYERSIRIEKNRFVLGSLVSADVRVTGDGIEPIHAVCEWDSATKTLVIYDLASRSGVLVNGEVIVRCHLVHGDCIRLGQKELEVDLKHRPLQERIDPIVDERFVESILKPRAERALQVIQCWWSTVLACEHHVSMKAITIGQGKNVDFFVPMPGDRIELCTPQRGSWDLCLDSAMSGVLQRKGTLHKLSELAQGGLISLFEGDFVKVQIGEMDMYCCFTEAPPRIRHARFFERDPLWWAILLSTVALSVLMGFVLSRMHIDHELNIEQVPDRLATILYDPKKFMPPPPPVPVVKKVEAPVVPKKVVVEIDQKAQPKPASHIVVAEATKVPVRPAAHAGGAEAKEGAGARAAGREGKRGHGQAHMSVPTDKMVRTGLAKQGAGASGHAKSANDGNVDLFAGGSELASILGNAQNALDKGGGTQSAGSGGMSSRGAGGLGATGTGSGGGGDARTTLGGLAKSGSGMGRVGVGSGAVGHGSGTLGHLVHIQSTTPGDGALSGGVDTSALYAAIMEHKDEFQLCYEREVNADSPHAAGKVTLRFVIGSSGHVSTAGVESTSLHNPAVERCTISVMKRILFPVPVGAGTIEAKFTFSFSSQNKNI